MRADAPSIMLAAGEASGDLHGAALCHALRAEAPGCRLFGMGGPRMAAAGMDLLVDVTAVAAAGGTEAVSLVPMLYRAYRRLRAVLDGARRPGVLVVIDFPEFNLRLARAACRGRCGRRSRPSARRDPMRAACSRWRRRSSPRRSSAGSAPGGRSRSPATGPTP